MSLTVRRQNAVDFDPKQIAEQLVLNSAPVTYVYLCEDGTLKYNTPCSEHGKRTLMTFYVKGERWDTLEELDDDTRTPLLEEVEREFKRSIRSLIDEVKDFVDSGDDEFEVTKWIYEYDIYLGEGLVPIGEATGVYTRVVGAYELTLRTYDKPDRTVKSNIGKIQKAISEWENRVRNSDVFQKIEKYKPIIESDIIDLRNEYIVRGKVVVDIPIVSEGLVTAIRLVRETQNGRN
ncbi:MAG: hypothetical protein QXT13_13390 [Pyrobaculum sp.]